MEISSGIMCSHPQSPRTAIWVAEQITGAKFVVQEDESGSTLIICDGIGYTMQPQPANEDAEPGEKKP